jgi:hypothetical protein
MMTLPGVGEAACRDYARHVARINAESWRKAQSPTARRSLRTRLGTALIALGLRLTPSGRTQLSSRPADV